MAPKAHKKKHTRNSNSRNNEKYGIFPRCTIMAFMRGSKAFPLYSLAQGGPADFAFYPMPQKPATPSACLLRTFN